MTAEKKPIGVSFRVCHFLRKSQTIKVKRVVRMLFAPSNVNKTFGFRRKCKLVYGNKKAESKQPQPLYGGPASKALLIFITTLVTLLSITLPLLLKLVCLPMCLVALENKGSDYVQHNVLTPNPFRERFF